MLGALAIVFAFVVSPLPPTAGIVSVALLLVAILIAFSRTPRRVFELVPITCLIMTIWLAIGLANPNVLSVETGLLGLRLSLMFVLGVLLGYGWPSDRRPPYALIWHCLVVFSMLSIIVFLFFPELEGAISRGNDIYTVLFQGERRLQGLWASPAHASLASVFIVLTSVQRTPAIRSFPLRMMGLITGLVQLYLTQVRVGIIALIIGIAVVVILYTKLQSRIRIIYAIASAAIVVIAVAADHLSVWLQEYPALVSLLEAGSDSRLLGRVDTWEAGLDMVSRQPIFGWGPGSAGSTLGPLFVYGGHVTPHSPYLKYAVEGGLPALSLFIFLLFLLIVGVIGTRDQSKFGVAVFAPLLVTSITGTVVEAIPVSLVFAVVLGLIAAGFVERRTESSRLSHPSGKREL